MAGITPLERSLLLLVALLAALAGVADRQSWPALPRFAVATLALMGLAWLVSFATEQVGEHLGAGVTGVLQATLANLPELFVIVFALNAGELVVAQTAIVGSMLANALLLLGIVIVVGARRSRDGIMRFSERLPKDTTTLLLTMLFVVVLVDPSLGASGHASHLRTISAVSAVALLAVYVAWLLPYIRADRRGHAPEGESSRGGSESAPSDTGARPATGEGDVEAAASRLPAPAARVSLRASLVLLLAGGVGAAFVSEWFIDALRPAIDQLHISPAFAGLVIVAIAGNAVEHAASVVLAARGQSDLAISVVKNSVAQIAAFLFPALVLISLALPTQLTFALPAVYIAALGLMTLLVWQITGDGEASAFEGWALAAVYVVVAVVAAYQ